MSYSTTQPDVHVPPVAAMLLFFCVLTLAVALASRHHSVTPPPQDAASVRAVAPALPKAAVTLVPPHPPTVFEKESAMAPTALLARWNGDIAEASQRFHVPQDWIRAVMRQESGGRTMLAENLPMTSSTGAMGIMQVMPQTWDEMRAQYRLGADPYDPHDNVLAGAAYLRVLQQKYGYPAMFAAYNDGPGNLELNMAGKHALPAETVAYLANIQTRLGDTPKQLPGNAAAATLTRPDGAAVEIAALSVKSVRAVLPGEYPDSAAAVIDLGKSRQAVREDVAAATMALRLAGARL